MFYIVNASASNERENLKILKRVQQQKPKKIQKKTYNKNIIKLSSL